MKTLLASLAIAVLASSAAAQTVSEPVRFQYGAYNEVYYGGTNPTFAHNAYVYLPPALQAAYSAQRLNTPPYINAYTPYGPGTAFFSPYASDATGTHAAYQPLIFSDYLPYQEVGQFGYTVDDARNEAYANVPRLQTGMVHAVNPSLPPQAEAPVHPVALTSPQSQAIPLLSWAKAERTRNPELYKAIMAEAYRLDPVATDAVEHSVATEK